MTICVPGTQTATIVAAYNADDGWDLFAKIALYTSNKAATAFIAEHTVSFRSGMGAVPEHLQLKGQDETLIYTETNYYYYYEQKQTYINNAGRHYY